MTTSMWIALLAWCLLLIGYSRRSIRAQHVPLMISAIALDISLVVYLQITRNAVQKAMEFSMEPLQQLHVLFATLTLLLYVPAVYLGIQLLRGGQTAGLRQRHKRVAITALLTRTLSLLLMLL